MKLTLIDVFVLVGFWAVVPAAWPRLRSPRWAVSVALLVPALVLAPGAAMPLFVLPALLWVVAVGVGVMGGAQRAPTKRARRDALIEMAMAALLFVATGAVAAHARGEPVLGIHEPIIELTAVHFAFAGVGALALADAARARTAGAARRIAHVAVALSLVAPPVVATGFLSQAALPQVGGAILMTVGVWCTAIAQLAALPAGLARWCLVASSAAVAVAMPLAVAWAAGQHWGTPALSVQDMVRTHGLLNGVVFVPAGLLGWHLASTPGARERGRPNHQELTA